MPEWWNDLIHYGAILTLLLFMICLYVALRETVEELRRIRDVVTRFSVHVELPPQPLPHNPPAQKIDLAEALDHHAARERARQLSIRLNQEAKSE